MALTMSEETVYTIEQPTQEAHDQIEMGFDDGRTRRFTVSHHGEILRLNREDESLAMQLRKVELLQNGYNLLHDITLGFSDDEDGHYEYFQAMPLVPYQNPVVNEEEYVESLTSLAYGVKCDTHIIRGSRLRLNLGYYSGGAYITELVSAGFHSVVEVVFHLPPVRYVSLVR